MIELYKAWKELGRERWGVVAAILVMLLVATSSRAEQLVPNPCIETMQKYGFSPADSVEFSGDKLSLQTTSGLWEVDYDTITMRFGKETVVVNQKNSVNLSSLMDWIWSAENATTKEGFPALAGRKNDGSLTLASGMILSDGTPWCMGQPIRFK